MSATDHPEAPEHPDTPVHPDRLGYAEVQASPEFVELKRRFRRFVFPMTAFFLTWYFAYVLLADYAPGFMSTRVTGNITIGLLMGLGQFVTTFAITMTYVRWAGRTADPVAKTLRERIEGADL